MKEDLRVIKYILVFVIVALFWNFANVRWQTRTMQYEMRQLNTAITERDHLDSLYYEHLKNCSFIDKESVKVGYRGVLYSQYHKSNGKIK